ncbi:MAG: hypothetical protein JW929_06065 [Anaerolineales bacterium]|nr:hypothetical protein [Anaerolineales bacterium]
MGDRKPTASSVIQGETRRPLSAIIRIHPSAPKKAASTTIRAAPAQRYPSINLTVDMILLRFSMGMPEEAGG